MVFSCNKTISQTFFWGIHPSSLNHYEYAIDLGVNYNREGKYLFWDWVDETQDSSLNYKAATMPEKPELPNSGGILNYDDEREKLLHINGIELMNNICPCYGVDFDLSDTATYRYFVEKTVERYDGDADLGCIQTNGIDCYNLGDNEYPEEDLIGYLENNPIMVWQVCNQVTDACDGPECSENELYAEKYAIVQKITYEAVKSSCPECLVAIGGDSYIGLYPAVFNKLNGKFIDIIDFHRFGMVNNYNPKEDFDYLKARLEDAGFDLSGMKFWITETGTYSGDPVPKTEDLVGTKNDWPYQSEKQQAIGLIKTYISAYAYGIETVLWAWGLVEGFQKDGAHFDYTGIMYDGFEWIGSSAESGAYSNDSTEILYDRGINVPKLAYYTFKQMTEKINGATAISVITEFNGIYVYEVIVNDESFYIAWSESDANYEMSNIISGKLKITRSIPDAEYGEEITDFQTAFYTEYLTVSNNSATIPLDTIPVYIELSNAIRIGNNETYNRQIHLYPNPSNDGTVNFPPGLIKEIGVYGINGAKIEDFNINTGQSSIDLTNYPGGLYILKISESDFIAYEKLLICP
jgi:hypothetical protein